MAGERRYIPASEFCASVRDGTHDSPKPVQNGRKFVTSRHLTTGRLDLSDAYLISEEDFEAINKRSKVDRWDVLISMIGTVGEPCLIKEEPDFAIKNIGLFKTKSEEDGKWLYYFLRSKDAQQRIREQSRGTTQQYIPLGALRDFPILVANDPEEQKAIAAVLGALDYKIELNLRMNATLEAMARALFQSWFVDFDPVRAKLDGRQPAGIDPGSVALFPGHLEHKVEGVIPTGWTATTLGEVIEISDSKRIPLSGREREARRGKYPYHGAASVMDYVDDFLFDGIHVLMGEDGSVINEDGTPVLQYVWGKFWVNNHAHVLRGKNGISTEHLLLHLKGCSIAPFVNGAVQPKLNQGNMKRIPFMLPPPEIGQAFAKAIDPLFAQIRTNIEQSRTLATLRDTLLPKLLSGELSVISDWPLCQ